MLGSGSRRSSSSDSDQYKEQHAINTSKVTRVVVQICFQYQKRDYQGYVAGDGSAVRSGRTCMISWIGGGWPRCRSVGPLAANCVCVGGGGEGVPA